MKKYIYLGICLIILLVPTFAKATVMPIRKEYEVTWDTGGSVSSGSDVTKLSFCEDASPIFQFIGKFILILKIVVPLVIIVLGIIDFAKAVVSNDDKALQLATGSLVKRLVIGVAIFFVPTIVSFILSSIKEAAPFLESAEACQVCMLKPNDNECKIYVSSAKSSVRRS